MEEEKAAAYYEELTRKGEGAARFKQGLGFSSSNSSQTTTSKIPSSGSALPSSSSFLSSFVRASSPGKLPEVDKQAQLYNIQNKLKKSKQRSDKETHSRVSDNRSRDENRRRSSSRERDRSSRRRSRSIDRYDSRRRHKCPSRERARSGRSRRSRSRSSSTERERGRRSKRSRSRSSSIERERHRRRSGEVNSKGRRSRSSSPPEQRLEKGGVARYKDRRSEAKGHKQNAGLDYSSLIKGYEDMTPAERVKAKMKLQLSQTAEKDTVKGMGEGWGRFEFNKDAPLDDEEIEVAEDDAVLVKNIGQSFRFSAIEARREERIKAAHDEAMFGAPTAQASSLTDRDPIIEDNEKQDDNDKKVSDENGLGSNLISEKVLAKQQGSWRDRARKL